LNSFTWPIAKALLLAALVCGLLPAGRQTAPPPSDTQQEPAPEPPPKPQFFAGTVTALEHETVTVSRNPVGRAPEVRVFVTNAKTKSSHPLKVKARVTVRYLHMPEGDVALEIEVHSVPKTPRPS
jgi:hypothetical protein